MKPKSKLPIAPKRSPLGSPQKHAEAPTHADHGHESLPGESGERRWEQRNHVPRPETIISLRFRRGIREGLHQTSPPPHPTPSRCRLVALGCPALAAPGHWVSSEAFVWPPFDPPLTPLCPPVHPAASPESFRCLWSLRLNLKSSYLGEPPCLTRASPSPR